jgi:hypothetical protein
MFPDTITPRSFPEKLAQLDYDPFHLMPKGFPARPYIWTSPAKLAITRRLIRGKGWPPQALELLLKRAAEPCEIPEIPQTPPTEDHPKALDAVKHALRNAFAAVLLDDTACRERGLDSLRRLARAYPLWSVKPDKGRLRSGGISEGGFIHMAAAAYDLLAVKPLAPEDDRLFRAFLESTVASSNASGHPYCGNHATAVMRGRLAAAAALGNLQGVHDTLYGFTHNGHWRYGLIHQLRHDFLSDGLHWERSPGYHYLTLHLVSEMADVLENLGIDLWHAKLPPLQQDDSHDLHRAYGPAKGFKTIQAAFDAPCYLSLSNGDLSLFGDSGLANLRATYIWGTMYDFAYEAYKDPLYARLLSRAEAEYPQAKRAFPGLPMPFQNTWIADLSLARIRRLRYPAGRQDWNRDRPLSLSGRHTKGCTLFPVYGAAVLRSKPEKTEAPGAFLFWGPHVAGHQAPGSLHADFFAGGRRITDAPAMDKSGYSDPLNPTWIRTTIAHNTVTVDRKSMFPYDFPTQSIWECDRWRDSISDGERVLFQPDSQGFKAVRAKNENVYKGVTLDRTLAMTETFILDVYRVTADRVRLFDWAMHVNGTPGLPPGCRNATLGTELGYRHFSDVRRLPCSGKSFKLTWSQPGVATTVSAVLPPRCSAWTGRDPVPAEGHLKIEGEIKSPPARHTLLLRTRGKSALFVSAWSFTGMPTPIRLVKGSAETDVIVKTGAGAAARTWTFPIAANPLLCNQKG